MKQRALAIAIRRIIWAELALSAAIAVPAFAQSQPAATEATPATPATAPGGTTSGTTPPTPGTSGVTGTGTRAVKQLQTFQVTGSLIRSSDKVGFNQVDRKSVV